MPVSKTIKKHFLINHENDRNQLKSILQTIPVLFSLTTDGWSKNVGEVIPYISLTLHWINTHFD